MEIIKMDIIEILIVNAINIRNKLGIYPPIIYLGDDEFKQIEKFKPIGAFPDWHIKICGARVKRLKDI